MDCIISGKCCIHAQSNVDKKSSSSLLTISLDMQDMELGAMTLGEMTEEDITREIDIVSGRVKMAEYITKVLVNRLQSLNSALSSLKGSIASDSSDSRPMTPPEEIEAPLPAPLPVSKPARPAPLIRRHTTMATPTTKEMAAGGWEERAAAFMMKRRSQQSARDQVTTAVPQSPPMSPNKQRFFNPASRWITQSPDPRPTPRRISSEQDDLEGESLLLDLERRKQNSHRRALLSAAFAQYQETWEGMGRRMLEDHVEPYLTFLTVPWPTFRSSDEPVIEEPEDINVDSVREFILSPSHSTERGKESRIRDALLRWHPDHSNKWLDLVLAAEKPKVLRGIDKVNWCLDYLK